MRAIQLIKKGAAENAFEMRDMAAPQPVKDEVLIRVQGFGLNYADVMARLGLYREAPPMPCIIGYDVVGRVEKVGPDADESLVGKRVTALTRFGGYAEYAVSRAPGVVEIPEELDACKASALATQGATAIYMTRFLRRFTPGEYVLVHAAAGGVGSLVTQILSAEGVKVIGIVGSDEKVNQVMDCGAYGVVNRKKGPYDEAVQRILEGHRLAASFNAVAGKTFKKDMQLLGSSGMLILFGGASLTSAKYGILSMLNFLRQMGLLMPISLMGTSKSIAGVNMLKIGDKRPDILQACMKEAVELTMAGKLDPMIGGKFPVDDLEVAHAMLENGKTHGKLYIEW